MAANDDDVRIAGHDPEPVLSHCPWISVVRAQEQVVPVQEQAVPVQEAQQRVVRALPRLALERPPREPEPPEAPQPLVELRVLGGWLVGSFVAHTGRPTVVPGQAVSRTEKVRIAQPDLEPTRRVRRRSVALVPDQ
jgi:hypothetical protein